MTIIKTLLTKDQLKKSKSEKGHNIHAILLIARLFNDNSLSNFDLSNLIVVETAMKLMGLDNLAKKLELKCLLLSLQILM